MRRTLQGASAQPPRQRVVKKNVVRGGFRVLGRSGKVNPDEKLRAYLDTVYVLCPPDRATSCSQTPYRKHQEESEEDQSGTV